MNFSQIASRQRLSLVVLIIAALLLAFLCLYKAKAMSYNKIEPYTIDLSATTKDDNLVYLSYDYGYGIRDEHIRPLKANNGKISASLSVSAWKHISALYFIAPKDKPYTINSLQITKNGVSFSPSLPASGPTLEGENWLYRLPLTEFNYSNR